MVTRHEAWRRTSSTVPSCYPDQDPTSHREVAPRARPAPSLQPHTQEHSTRPSLGKSPSMESWGFQPPIGARQGVCQERTATRPSLGSGPFPRDRSSSRSLPVAWKNAQPSVFQHKPLRLQSGNLQLAEILRYFEDVCSAFYVCCGGNCVQAFDALFDPTHPPLLFSILPPSSSADHWPTRPHLSRVEH